MANAERIPRSSVVNARTTHYMLIRRHHACPGSTIARYKHAVYAVLATLLFGTPSRQLWTHLGSYQNCTSLVLNRSTAALPLLLLPLPPPMLPGLSFQWLRCFSASVGYRPYDTAGTKQFAHVIACQPKQAPMAKWVTPTWGGKDMGKVTLHATCFQVFMGEQTTQPQTCVIQPIDSRMAHLISKPGDNETHAAMSTDSVS